MDRVCSTLENDEKYLIIMGEHMEVLMKAMIF